MAREIGPLGPTDERRSIARGLEMARAKRLVNEVDLSSRKNRKVWVQAREEDSESEGAWRMLRCHVDSDPRVRDNKSGQASAVGSYSSGGDAWGIHLRRVHAILSLTRRTVSGIHLARQSPRENSRGADVLYANGSFILRERVRHLGYRLGVWCVEKFDRGPR